MASLLSDQPTQTVLHQDDLSVQQYGEVIARLLETVDADDWDFCGSALTAVRNKIKDGSYAGIYYDCCDPPPSTSATTPAPKKLLFVASDSTLTLG